MLSIVLAATGKRGRIFVVLCGAAVILMGLEIAIVRI
jgi:hypothetical protein